MTFKMSETDQTVTVYNLRSDTNEFIGSGDAFIPAHTGLPANCTTIKPPTIKAGFIAVFDANEKNGKALKTTGARSFTTLKPVMQLLSMSLENIRQV